MALLAYLSASQAVLTGNDERDLYICGALLVGWLFGVLFGRRLDRRLARASNPDRDDELGEAGARGAFVAVYLGACTSKLLEAGGSWLDGRNLLSHVVSQHEFTGGVLDRYLTVVLDHPRLADVFAAATLFIQAGMLLYLVGPRLRMLWGGLVIGFHLNAYLLMGVKYFNPIFAALALSYPWPRILRRLRGAPAIQPASAAPRSDTEPGALSAVAWQATGWVVLAGVAAVVVWWGVHARDSASLFVERPHDLPHQP